MNPHQSHAENLISVDVQTRGRKPSILDEIRDESIFSRILVAALQHARFRKCDVDKFLIHSGYLTENQLYRKLAARLGVPFISFPVRLNPTISPSDALRTGLAPVDPKRHGLPADTPLFIYAPQGPRLEWLIAENLPSLGWPGAHIGITTPRTFSASVRATFGRKISGQATMHLVNTCRCASAYSIPSFLWFGLIAFFLGIMIVSLAFMTAIWHGLLLAISIFPIVPGLILKIVALRHSEKGDIHPVSIEEYALPTYSILVPIFRESLILPQLIDSLVALDYPAEKLDIKILAEANDSETLAALNRHVLPAHFDVIICPRGEPRTKPRALTIGLAYSTSELIVVYDAEDCPEPDQLKKAAAIFVGADQNLACLQARLSIDNLEDSWLTRQFALEYGALFDVLLPGLADLDQPIPLGGTSNHFRRSALNAVSAWDPWNVTEDADLGLRLFRAGYRIKTFNSTTYEEAPASFRAWSDQRTRWLKGWMQTACVHLRSHGRNRDHINIWKWSALILTTSLSPICILLHPALLLTLDVAIRLATRDSNTSSLNLMMQFGFVILFCCSFYLDVKIMRRGARIRSINIRLSDVLGLLPYSLIKTRAGWLALIELLHMPYHWRKTAHGLARTSRRLRRHESKTAS